MRAEFIRTPNSSILSTQVTSVTAFTQTKIIA